MPVIEQRVDKLEQALAELAHAQMRTEMMIQAQAKDTEAYKEESRRELKRMNKMWGDLANKLGTVAEDIVAPNIPRIARDEFGVQGMVDLVAGPTRVSRRGEARRREYDVVCAGDEKVLVVEVKTSPNKEKILEFVDHLAEFGDFFPEYEGWQTIGLFASWWLPEELREFVSANGLYGLAMGDETMDVVARPA